MSEMVERAAKAIFEAETSCDFEEHKDEDFHVSARAALLAALDPPRHEISAISDESSVSFELVCSVLMALRRRAQGVTDAR